MAYRERIPIFFTIDKSYAPFASVAIQSIIQNANSDYEYQIFVLYENLLESDKKKISEVNKKENFEIEFILMKDGFGSITDRTENRLRCDYFTLTIYFRLFIADLFPEFDKGIYLDSDVIILGDISKLYSIDLKGNVIGASNDYSIQDVPELVGYVENAVGVERKKYINSGVLLMNLKLMREKNFLKKFLELLNTYHFDSVAPDQDYLNAMCYGKIGYLDKVWNTMPGAHKEPIKGAKIIHYNLFQKPWFYDHITYEEYFWKYAKQNSYYEKIIEIKYAYSDLQKQYDNECMKMLINKASKLPEATVTFKKMLDNGVNIRL